MDVASLSSKVRCQQFYYKIFCTTVTLWQTALTIVILIVIRVSIAMFKDTWWCKNLQHEEQGCRWARSRTTESPQGGRSCLPSPRTSCRSFLKPCSSSLGEFWHKTNLDMSLIQVNLCNTSTPCSSLPIAPPSNRSSSASSAWWCRKRENVERWRHHLEVLLPRIF